jgi:putative addiction module killer protein
MPAGEYSLRYYLTANGRRPFAEWLWSLSDRLRLGNFGDARPLGRGLSELRIDVGPGYRVYFITEVQATIVLLCGGNKSTQQRDIRRAREYAVDYRRRTDA